MTRGSSTRRTGAVIAGSLALSMMHVAAVRADEPLPSINLPLEGWTVVALDQGILQDEYNKIGTGKVELIDPGTAQLIGSEAALLDRGGLAIAQRMMYPAAVHKANGIDAEIVWLSTASSEYRTPVLSLKDSPIQTVADLDGKNFGSSRIGCGWTSPTEILNQAGVPLDTPLQKGKVRYSNITNSVANVNALLSGRIDAMSTHVALSDAAALWASGQVKVIGRSPTDGVYVNAAGRVSYFAMHDFVTAHPKAIQAFLKARDRTDAWVKADPDEAAKIVARETRVPLYIAKFQITDPSSFEFIEGEPSAEAAVASIKTFQAWYIDHGDDILAKNRLSDEVIESFVDKKFFKGGEYSVYD
jgi:sulfonate transport system substrate-binding protein